MGLFFSDLKNLMCLLNPGNKYQILKTESRERFNCRSFAMLVIHLQRGVILDRLGERSMEINLWVLNCQMDCLDCPSSWDIAPSLAYSFMIKMVSTSPPWAGQGDSSRNIDFVLLLAQRPGISVTVWESLDSTARAFPVMSTDHFAIVVSWCSFSFTNCWRRSRVTLLKYSFPLYEFTILVAVMYYGCKKLLNQ